MKVTLWMMRHFKKALTRDQKTGAENLTNSLKKMFEGFGKEPDVVSLSLLTKTMEKTIEVNGTAVAVAKNGILAPTPYLSEEDLQKQSYDLAQMEEVVAFNTDMWDFAVQKSVRGLFTGFDNWSLRNPSYVAGSEMPEFKEHKVVCWITDGKRYHSGRVNLVRQFESAVKKGQIEPNSPSCAFSAEVSGSIKSAAGKMIDTFSIKMLAPKVSSKIK